MKTPEVSMQSLIITITIIFNPGKRDIQALRVKCRNVATKCKWKGTVSTLEAHVAICEFTLVPCPNECKDDKNEIAHFIRKDLEKHLKNRCLNRDHKCERCGEKGTYAHITQVHDDTCEKKRVSCPNADCTKTIQRRNTKRHLEECDYSEIPCKYQRLGCDVKMMRKDIPSHEDEDKLHLHMALDKVISMEKKITTIILRKGDSLTFKFEEFQEEKDNGEEFYSPAFYCLDGYRMGVEVVANGDDEGEGTHVSVYVDMLEGKHDAKLKWPFAGNVTIQILNQLKDKNHYTLTLNETNMVVGEDWGWTEFITHSKLAYDPVKKTQYLKDDTLYFRVSVDAPDYKPWLECTEN